MAVALIPTPVSAMESGTETIPAGTAWVYHFSYSGSISLHYQVIVNSGPNVDVIVTDATGYDQYQNSLSGMQYLSSYSTLDTRSATFDNNIEGGDYYLLIDNSMAGSAQSNGQAASVTYSIDAHAAGAPDPFSDNGGAVLTPGMGVLLIVGIIILVGVLIAAFLIVRAKNRKQSNAQIPRPPMPPPPQYAYYPPKYSPQYQPAPAPRPPGPPIADSSTTAQSSPPGPNYCPFCGSEVKPHYNICPMCSRRLK